MNGSHVNFDTQYQPEGSLDPRKYITTIIYRREKKLTQVTEKGDGYDPV